jgi:hypothetical protein
MKKEELTPYIGKIIACDLVNRERPVCRLQDVTDTHAILKDPYIYVPVPVGQGMQIQALSYAAPLFDIKEIRVQLEHIMMLLEIQPQMEQAYIRQTSGIITETKPSIIVP